MQVQARCWGSIGGRNRAAVGAGCGLRISNRVGLDGGLGDHGCAAVTLAATTLMSALTLTFTVSSTLALMLALCRLKELDLDFLLETAIFKLASCEG